jgi:4-hydroxybenzoate polyprenyltransferase
MSLNFAIALGISYLLGTLTFYLSLSYLFLAILYSVKPFRFRRFLFASNFIGAYLYGAFPYLLTFSIIAGNFSIVFPVFFFALIFSMVQLKDIEDMNWEKITGIKSVPILIGKRNTIKLVILLLFLINFAMLFLILKNYVETKYLYASIFSCLLLAPLVIFFKKNLSENRAIVTQSSLVTATMAAIMLIELAFAISNVLL